MFKLSSGFILNLMLPNEAENCGVPHSLHSNQRVIPRGCATARTCGTRTSSTSPSAPGPDSSRNRKRWAPAMRPRSPGRVSGDPGSGGGGSYTGRAAGRDVVQRKHQKQAAAAAAAAEEEAAAAAAGAAAAAAAAAGLTGSGRQRSDAQPEVLRREGQGRSDATFPTWRPIGAREGGSRTSLRPMADRKRRGGGEDGRCSPNPKLRWPLGSEFSGRRL